MSHTNSMLRSQTPEPKISSGNQYNPPRFMEPQSSSHYSSQPTSCPYLEPDEPSSGKLKTFLSESFYKMCMHKRALSFRYSYQGT